MEAENGFFDMLQQFMGGNPLYAFMPCAVFLLLMNLQKEHRKLGLVAVTMFVVLIFNPISYKILLDKFGLQRTYYRFLWMIPIVPLFAYLIYEVIRTIKDAKWRIFMVIMTCLVIFATSTRLGSFQLPSNIYQVPDDVVEICNQLENLVEEHDKATVNIVTDPNICNVIRQYDAHVCLKALLWGTEALNPERNSEDATTLMSMLTYDRNDMPSDIVGRIIENNQIEFLVPPKANVNFIEYMQQLGWNVVGETEGYYILANETI